MRTSEAKANRLDSPPEMPLNVELLPIIVCEHFAKLNSKIMITLEKIVIQFIG